VNGGTYNADGLTVADVLSTTGVLPAVAAAAPAAAAAAPAAAAAAAPAVATSTPAPATTVAAVDAGAPAAGNPAAFDMHQSTAADMAHHFHHMWG
jgi:hypothetical protein